MQKCYKKWLQINEWMPNCFRNCVNAVVTNNNANSFVKLHSPNFFDGAGQQSSSNSTANSATSGNSSDISECLMVNFFMTKLANKN